MLWLAGSCWSVGLFEGLSPQRVGVWVGLALLDSAIPRHLLLNDVESGIPSPVHQALAFMKSQRSGFLASSAY